jgi:hypothetical protein
VAALRELGLPELFSDRLAESAGVRVALNLKLRVSTKRPCPASQSQKNKGEVLL